MFLNTPGHPTADRKDHHHLDLKVVWKDIFPNLWTLLHYFLRPPPAYDVSSLIESYSYGMEEKES